jgi:hypothetical protein
MVAGNMTVPGPASYSPVLEAVAKHAPAHGFAKAKPKGGADFVPGPGQYSDDNTVGMKVRFGATSAAAS